LPIEVNSIVTAAEEVNNSKRLSKKSVSSFMTLMGFMKPYRVLFGLGIAALVLSTLTFMAFPFLISMLTDIAQAKPFQLSWGQYQLVVSNRNQLVGILMVIILLQSTFSFLRVYLFAQVNERVLADIRSALYSKIITLEIPFFEKTRIGDLISRLSGDTTSLQELMSFNLAEFFRQLVSLIGGTIIIFLISPKLTGLIIVVVPTIVLIALFLGKTIKRMSKDVLKASAEATVITEEAFQNITTVKAYTNEQYESLKHRGAVQKILHLAIKASIFRGGFISFIILGLFGALIVILWQATGYVEDGSMTVGTLLAFIAYTIFIGGSVGGMGDLWGKIVSSLGAADRIVEILDLSSETEIKAVKAIKFNGAVSFKDIHFSYPSRPDIPIFHNLNFEIQAGETVALVGPSGAGKSSIVQLLLQYYKPEQGEIYIDGRACSTMDVQELRANMAIVPQEVILFGGTIRENIAYGDLSANDRQIESAAIKANCWEFIQQFPEGLDTIVGERGVKLSGGQRQRIAIARAILKDPAILLLDEATSALDSESERLVQEALETLMRGRTTVVIAHRLSTIRNADKILVLQNGQIIESGNHESLSALPDGLYQNLLRLQYQAG
jgi:ABC-type multidrug transport system fused ATPase/permease subunit